MSFSFRPVALLLLVFAALAALVWTRERGPDPAPLSAPLSTFSAQRARAELSMLLGDGTPHPIGSPNDAAVRGRLVGRLRELGFEVEERPGFGCTGYGLCAKVINVVARRPGAPREPAVVLSAHLDSVAAGPGASDDGMGVAAILEVARALGEKPARRPLLILISDGEEGGMLGAEAVVRDPALLHELGVVINIENRGTSGPSNLFETSRPNGWLIDAVGPSLARPHASSLFASIYELLPNDTDLSVYKAAGVAGINFAAIGDVWRYHTPLDSLANADLRTLQHHGDAVLTAARTLLQAEAAVGAAQNAIYFDVLSIWLLRWPDALTPLLAGAVLLLALLAALWAARREGAGPVLAGGLAWVLGLVVAAALGVALVRMLGGLRPNRVHWLAHPLPLIAAQWMAGLGAALLSARLLRRGSAAAALAGAAVAWALLGIALVVLLRGGCYLALVPAVACAVGSLIARRPAGAALACLLALIVVGLLFLPLAELLYGALGTVASPALALLLALIGSAIAPLTVRAKGGEALLAALLAASIAAVLFAARQPQWTADRPLGLDIDYVQLEGGRAQWMTTDVVPPLQDLAHFSRSSEASPWASGLLPTAKWAAPAPSLGLPVVSLAVLGDQDRAGKRVLTVRVASQRHARFVQLVAHGAAPVEAIRVDGVRIPPQARPVKLYAEGWSVVVAFQPEATIELTLGSHAPLALMAEDSSLGLPPLGAPLAAARSGAGASPIHEGDSTKTRRELPPG